MKLKRRYAILISSLAITSLLFGTVAMAAAEEGWEAIFGIQEDVEDLQSPTTWPQVPLLKPRPLGSVPNETEATGGGQAHGNMHPYTGLRAIIALVGIFPSYSSPSSPGSDPFLGEIRWVAFNFAPRGWAFCDGQLLSIAEHTALFALLGTMYGGDGRTTFALPDLRGRSPLHAGRGSGLTDRRIGEKGGVETVTITTDEMPSHTHDITYPSPTITDVTDSPDPFNPSIGETSTISYKLSDKCYVTVRIRDPAGRTIKILRATQPAGANSMTWDGRVQRIIVPDGTYTYEISATDMDGNEATPAKGTTTVKS